MQQNQARPVCVVAGAGPGNGLAYARRFQASGYRSVLLARNNARLQGLIEQEPEASHLTARGCDLTDATQITIFYGGQSRAA